MGKDHADALVDRRIDFRYDFRRICEMIIRPVSHYNEFKNTDPIHAVATTDPETDYISETGYNDSNTKNPYGVSVSQKVFSNSGDDFLIIEFGFTPTSSALEDFYAGIFADWDVGSDDG